MCIDKKDIRIEVEKSERHMDERLEKMYMSLSKVISAFGADLKEVNEKSSDALLDRNSIFSWVKIGVSKFFKFVHLLF